MVTFQQTINISGSYPGRKQREVRVTLTPPPQGGRGSSSIEFRVWEKRPGHQKLRQTGKRFLLPVSDSQQLVEALVLASVASREREEHEHLCTAREVTS
jgi:hypothetical protein